MRRVDEDAVHVEHRALKACSHLKNLRDDVKIGFVMPYREQFPSPGQKSRTRERSARPDDPLLALSESAYWNPQACTA
jgi:hypothetical protein